MNSNIKGFINFILLYLYNMLKFDIIFFKRIKLKYQIYYHRINY